MFFEDLKVTFFNRRHPGDAGADDGRGARSG